MCEIKFLTMSCNCIIFVATQTAVGWFSFFKTNKAVFFFISQTISFRMAEIITLKGRLCFTRWPQSVEKVTSAYRSVFVWTWPDTHYAACSFIAWDLLLQGQNSNEETFQVTRGWSGSKLHRKVRTQILKVWACFLQRGLSFLEKKVWPSRLVQHTCEKTASTHNIMIPFRKSFATWKH